MLMNLKRFEQKTPNWIWRTVQRDSKKLHLEDVEEGDLRIVGADEEEKVSESANNLCEVERHSQNYFIKR